MIVNTFENCINTYKSFNAWEDEFDKQREENFKEFPYSVIVEGIFEEHDMAYDWCQKNIGEIKDDKNNGAWTYLWYYKTSYNYGFWEFFFKEKEMTDKFKNAVPGFYAVGPKGKWKTNGDEENIDLD